MKANFKIKVYKVAAFFGMLLLLVGLFPLPGLPQNVPNITPTKIEPCPFKGGERLEYEFGWNGIPAATAAMAVHEEKINGVPVLRLRTEAQTIGKVRLLWKMDDWGESIVSPTTLKPLSFIMHQSEAGAVVESIVGFDRQSNTAIITKKSEARTRYRARKFLDAYDPLSLAYLLRCLKFKVGERKVFEIVDGSETYRCIFDVIAAETIKVRTGTYAAYKIRPSFVQVPPPKKAEDKILYKADLWIDIEPPHHLLMVKSKLMVGSVYGELTKITTEP